MCVLINFEVIITVMVLNKQRTQRIIRHHLLVLRRSSYLSLVCDGEEEVALWSKQMGVLLSENDLEMAPTGSSDSITEEVRAPSPI